MKHVYLQKKSCLPSWTIHQLQLLVTNMHKKCGKHSKTFKIKSMRKYHDLYLKSGVILLVDVFETFRNVCIKNYKLDPNLPSLWNLTNNFNFLHFYSPCHLKICRSLLSVKILFISRSFFFHLYSSSLKLDL